MMRTGLGAVAPLLLLSVMPLSVAAAATAAGAAAVQRGTGSQLGPASGVLSLLRELQQEVQASLPLMGEATQWCHEAVGHRREVASTLRRQLQETAAAKQRVVAEAAQMAGQRDLAESALRSQEQRAASVSKMAEFAASEFASEGQKLQQTAAGADDALNLLNRRAESVAAAAAVRGEDVLPSPSGNADAGERSPRDLEQEITDLKARLSSDQAAGGEEQEALQGQLRGFQDRLSAAILQARSQVAAADMEEAQRQREQTRLESQVADLQRLLKAVERSEARAADVCKGEKAQRKQVASLIAAESAAARAVLGAAASTRQSELVADAASMTSAASFLQVARAAQPATGEGAANAAEKALADLAALAKELPAGDAEAYAPAAAGAGDEPGSAADAGNSKKVDAEGADALDDLRKFVGTSGADAKSVVAAAAGAAAEGGKKEGEDQGAWCQGILRGASSDRAALRRSLRQARAKLHIVNGAIAGNVQQSKYFLEQSGVIAEHTKKLNRLAQEADRQSEKLLSTLSHRAQQLSEGHESTGALVKAVERHRSVLAVFRAKTAQRAAAAAAADDTVRQLLEEDAKYATHRSIHLKSEARLLSSLARTRERALTGLSGASQKLEEDSVDMEADKQFDAAGSAVAALCKQAGFEEKQP